MKLFEQLPTEGLPWARMFSPLTTEVLGVAGTFSDAGGAERDAAVDEGCLGARGTEEAKSDGEQCRTDCAWS